MSPIASVDDTEITLEEIKRMRQEMLRLQEEKNYSLLQNYEYKMQDEIKHVK